jgi:hypothetical protein
MHPQEARSLRKLPEDGSVSEDDSEGTDDMQASSEEEKEESEFDDEQKQEEDYKIKWSNIRQPVTVVEYSSIRTNKTPCVFENYQELL